MSVEFPTALLIQFAKAPILGQVKTRMQPVLSPEQSLSLHCQLVQRTHQTIHANVLCHSQLWVAGADSGSHIGNNGAGFFQSLSPRPNIEYQRGGDLGERMHLAIAVGLQHWAGVVLIGSDCPGITRDYLRTALLALDRVDLVLGPAADGGYVLIAMKNPEARVFEAIDWSTSRVMAQTRAKLAELKLSSFELPVLHDIDRPEDLALFDALLPSYKITYE